MLIATLIDGYFCTTGIYYIGVHVKFCPMKVADNNIMVIVDIIIQEIPCVRVLWLRTTTSIFLNISRNTDRQTCSMLHSIVLSHTVRLRVFT